MGYVSDGIPPSPTCLTWSTLLPREDSQGTRASRLQGRNRKGTLNDEMKKVALPFLNWSNPSAVPFMG